MRLLLLLLPIFTFAYVENHEKDSSEIISKLSTLEESVYSEIRKQTKADHISRLQEYSLNKGEIVGNKVLKRRRILDNRILEIDYLIEYVHGYHVVTLRYSKVTSKLMKLTNIYVAKYQQGKYE